MSISLSSPSYSDELLRTVLRSSPHIAMVGASDNPARPSFRVFQYLIEHGYTVTPVNPARVGHRLLGVPFVASLAETETKVDMVDIFRAIDAVADVVDEALQLKIPPKVIWMQLGLHHETAAQRAEAAGITVIMDRCPKIEIARLFDVGFRVSTPESKS